MNSTDQFIALNHAGALHLLRRNLGSAGLSSIIWGIVWTVLFGLALPVAPTPLNVAYFLIGLALIAEGVYVRQKPSASAIRVEAVTLGALGLLGIFRFATALVATSQGQHKSIIGNPLFALIMIFNAYQSWAAQKVYTEAEQGTNPEAVATISRILEESKVKDASSSPNLIELKSRALITENPIWRILFENGVAYMTNWKPGTKKVVSIAVVPQSTLMLQVESERWIGKNVNIRFLAGGALLGQKYEITPAMLERSQLFLGMQGDVGARRAGV